MSHGSPGLVYNQEPTAGEWNAYFAAKQDWSAILDAVIANGGAPFFQAPASWTPSDQSGASLSFAGVTVTYSRVGNMVFLSGQLTYPTTADTNAAIIGGLPVPVPPQPYAKISALVLNNATLSLMGVTLPSSTTFELVTPAGVAITNAQLSGKTINFNFVYPAT